MGNKEKGEKQIKRVLDIYTRLCQGKVINKEEEAQKFHVTERSIQRDIAEINSFLGDMGVSGMADMREIQYDLSKKRHVMTGLEDTVMSNSEILAVSKILLESRAFTKEEIDRILNKLVSGCAPRESMKLVSHLISNEAFHYEELHKKSYIQDKLWEIGSEIEKCNLLEIVYQKQDTSKDAVVRTIRPQAILFSEYYFYLLADIVEKNKTGIYVLKFKESDEEYHPAVFRIDRIIEYKEIDGKCSIAYRDRFQEGEFRKRVQFMYMGPLITLKFKYTGKSLESILDRLPTAKVVSEPAEEGQGWILTAEVYGRGVLMWLMSQGSMVEILGPESARQKTKEMLQEMLMKYKLEFPA